MYKCEHLLKRIRIFLYQFENIIMSFYFRIELNFMEGKDDRKNYEGCKKWEQKKEEEI